MLIALLYKEATGSSGDAPKFCLIDSTPELKMLSSVIIASGFTGRKEEYVGCVMKYMFSCFVALGSLMLVDSNGIR